MDEDTTTYDDATIYDIMDVLLCLYLMMYGFGYKAFWLEFIKMAHFLGDKFVHDTLYGHG